MSQQTSATSIWVRSLLVIERLGNRLPAPALLFLLLIVFIIIISALCDVFSVQGIHPASKEVLEVNSLLSFDALRWWLQQGCRPDKQSCTTPIYHLVDALKAIFATAPTPITSTSTSTSISNGEGPSSRGFP